jgi:hypothetical protein
MNEEYAREIARRWNLRDCGAGFVTRFAVRCAFLDRYPVRKVGASVHLEPWVPAEELEAFNHQIVGRIEVVAEHRP